MASIEDRYRELKEEVDSAKQAASRAKGALDQIMLQLETEFGCKSLKQAKKLLEELESKNKRLEAKFDEMLKSYEKKWKEDVYDEENQHSCEGDDD